MLADRHRLDPVVTAAERAWVNLDTLRSGLEVAVTSEVVGR
jgi:hypothetical protein